MRLILLILILLVLFGGVGFYGRGAGWFVGGSPYGYGFGGVGFLVLILIILFVLGVL